MVSPYQQAAMKQQRPNPDRQKVGLIACAILYALSLPISDKTERSNAAVYAAAPKVFELLDTMTKQYGAGQYVQAGHTGQQILTIDPNNLTAHYLLGNIFLKAEVLDSAGREYEWCIAHGAGTKIGAYAKNALDVMEGKAPPPGYPVAASGATAPGHVPTGSPTGLPTGIPNNQQARGQAAQGTSQQNLPTQFSNPFNPNPNPNSNPNGNYLPPQQTQTMGASNGAPLGAPSKVQMQAGEYSQRALAQGESFIEGKRQTMEAGIKRINDDAKSDIRNVPKYIYVGRGRERIANPDYDSTVQAIKDEAAEKIKVLQADFDNEQNKIGTFYKKMADSYDKQTGSAMSQAESTRPHHVIDNDPSMFVRNYGKSAK